MSLSVRCFQKRTETKKEKKEARDARQHRVLGSVGLWGWGVNVSAVARVVTLFHKHKATTPTVVVAASPAVHGGATESASRVSSIPFSVLCRLVVSFGVEGS
jgi:hypothetical protein